MVCSAIGHGHLVVLFEQAAVGGTGAGDISVDQGMIGTQKRLREGQVSEKRLCIRYILFNTNCV